jgi:hypothetical protein
MTGRQRQRATLASGLLALLFLVNGCHVYRSDVGKLCDSEQLSQTSLKGNRAQLFTWMERHVASSEAVILVSGLEGKEARGISLSLREAARNAGVTSCALAEHADMLAKDQDYLTDMTNLCRGSAAKDDGSIARLDLGDADDAERMREIIAWTATNARSPDTTPLVAKMAAAGPRQRGTLLRTESSRVGVASCAMAATLDALPPKAQTLVVPVPNPSFVVQSVDAASKSQLAIATALTGAETSSAINACYAIALASAPKLTGKVVVDLMFDVNDKTVAKATDAGSTVKGPVVSCITTALTGRMVGAAQPDKSKKTGTRATVTLLLTPSLPGPGFTATIDPGVTGGKPHGHHH